MERAKMDACAILKGKNLVGLEWFRKLILSTIGIDKKYKTYLHCPPCGSYEGEVGNGLRVVLFDRFF